MGELKVKMLDGKELQIPLRDKMLTSELKQRIAEKITQPAYRLRLVIPPNGPVLENGDPLSMHGLGHGSTVLLLVQSCDTPLSILVRNNRGQNITYDVRLTQKVAELKQKVCQREKVNADLFWLSFQGTPMDDQKQLGEYGLTPNCTVQMNLRLRGGGAGPAGQTEATGESLTKGS